MASLQIGKYKRPGIFVEEFDNSVIASETVQGIVNLVIGVSKKGPVNTPILIKNTTDLKNYFGDIDRNLERKGSFFHRTVQQMIQSSPVYAINLLATDDTLDTIEYQPLATATNKTNNSLKTGPFRRFFDNTGFWKKDSDSFLTLAAENTNYGDRLLNLTNMSSNYITVFVFKTTATGFDRTLLDWYGTVTDIPLSVYPTDYASDYMVDVVVLSGDWSNYSVLSVDTKWSRYFDSTGLRKSQVENFINDQNVTLLKYYQGLSFIPYFRNLDGKNIFIETSINQDTNLTGLFCAFNMDAFDTDYPNGKIDLIGNNLVNNDSLINTSTNDIDFLSYQDSIVEIIPYSNTGLDLPGNVNTIDSNGTFSNGNISNVRRTNWYSEDSVYGIVRSSFTYSGASVSNGTASVRFNWGSPSNGVDTTPYAIIGGTKVNVAATASFVVSTADYGSYSVTQSYYVAFNLDSTGTINKTSTTSVDTKPSVATSDIVLGYMYLSIKGGMLKAITYTDVSVNTSGYIDLQNSTDYLISNSGVNNTFVITFTSSSGVPSTANYEQYRRIKKFNSIRNVLESTDYAKSVMLIDFYGTGYTKMSLANASISSVTSTSLDKSITVRTNFGLNETLFATGYTSISNKFLMYSVDNEQIFSDYKMLTTGSMSSTLTGTGSYGIVAKYSDIYQDFNDGVIKTGDYFYSNIATYTMSSILFTASGGNSYILMVGTTSGAPFDAETYRTISVPSSILNTGSYSISSTTNVAYSIFGYSASFNYAYKLAEAITNETVGITNVIYNAATKYYLAMYMDNSSKLTLNITDNSLTTWQSGLTLAYNQLINIKSNNSNFQETVEIKIPSGYTQVPNKVLVDGTRYTETVVGDFLEAYVDESLLVDGQVAKKLTRIINKKVYSGDTSLVELTCDARIYTRLFGSNYQTMRYSSLDNYVTTYKAITLKGFRIREASLPDGTETKQSSILDIVAKGTPLFKAITNKEAFDIRYLIDSFGLGLTELSKQQLVDICGERLDCLGFLNMPSMKSFRKSSSPTFTDSEGVLQTSYIASGGNLDSNPAFLYSFGEGRGTTCVGYFLPYLTVNDNGRPIEVPPAMFVATTYMRKQNTNLTSIVPWTIAAGISDGKITNIAGLEMDFNPTDIENLNLAQMNPIVVKKNRGWSIETENTAQTLYKSALSFLHVREVLIELERELSDMLKAFQWKFNTVDTRSEIKLRADGICAKYVNKNGLYNYFNKCDSENNTPTLIDNQIGLLQTFLEPIKGMMVIVNEINVLKTGAIQSGGFQ